MNGEDVGILLIRGIIGAFFAAHGCQLLFGWFGGRGIRQVGKNFHARGFRPGMPFALAAASTELFGGLGLALGLLWPLPAVALIGPMTVAVVSVHWPKIWVTEQGIEYPLVLGVVMAGAGMMSPGSISLDNAFDFSLPRSASYAVTLTGTLVVVAAALISARVVKQRADTAAPASPPQASAAPAARES